MQSLIDAISERTSRLEQIQAEAERLKSEIATLNRALAIVQQRDPMPAPVMAAASAAPSSTIRKEFP